MPHRTRTVTDVDGYEWEVSVEVSVPLDAVLLDPHPDRCWRCDARPSCDDLGLCEPCREVLT